MSARKRVSPAERLRAAMDRCAVARGEAQWTNGYRAAKEPMLSQAEADRLYAKEQAQWKEVERVQNAFRRLALRVLREAGR